MSVTVIFSAHPIPWTILLTVCKPPFKIGKDSLWLWGAVWSRTKAHGTWWILPEKKVTGQAQTL